MKRIVLLILVCVSSSLQAREVNSLGDLRVDDTFEMRITVPLGFPGSKSVWEFEQSQMIDVDLQVLAAGKDSVQVAIRPTRWFIYYQSPYDKNISVYLDSDYLLTYDGKSMFHQFDDNSATASISLNDGSVKLNLIATQEEKASIRKKSWYAQPNEFPKGIQLIRFKSTLPDFGLNFETLIQISLNRFVEHWMSETNIDHSIPWLIDLRSELKMGSIVPGILQILTASFDMPFNTNISFTAPKEMPEDRVFITLGNKRIRPVKKTSNTYGFSFFLPAPQRAYIQDIILDLTPEDSLSIRYDDSEGKYVFSGKGAANSTYANTQLKLFKRINEPVSFDEMDKYYRLNLSAHVEQMHSFWVKSAKLSYDYWYVSEQLKLYNEKAKKSWGQAFPSENEIPWESPYFKQIFPFTDYLYQVYTYADFLEAFFVYKASQANNSVLTVGSSLLVNTSGYNFAEAVFSYYPMSYLTSERLKKEMIHFQLERSQNLYESFIKRRHDPEIRESIVNLHDQLMKVEPGSNIREVGLDVEKHIPLKKKADGYIILLVGDSIGYNDIRKSFIKSLRSVYEDLQNNIDKANLEKKVKLCFITNEGARSGLDSIPELQKKITFVPDKMIRDYKDKVVSRKRCFLIMRDDGIILNRELDSSVYSDYGDAMFVLDVIIKDIESQKNKDSALGRVLVILFTILVSVVITFFIVRYVIRRQERVKSQIQELELKAIRAQMNPHFTFNALGSIQNLISQKKDKEANEYLVDFAKLLRMVLSTSEKKLVPLSEEIEQLDLYLRLEQLRVPFEYAINIDKNIHTEIEEIPGMLIQPIVENAVKHGIVPNGGGRIQLNLVKENQTIRIDIIDSGNGFLTTDMENMNGFGLKSVRERLYLLNKEHHLNMTFSIENILENGVIKGAKVSIFIPV